MVARAAASIMNLQVDDFICFEAGSGEPPWCGSRQVIGKDLETLQRLAHDRMIELEISGDSVHVAGTTRSHADPVWSSGELR